MGAPEWKLETEVTTGLHEHLAEMSTKSGAGHICRSHHLLGPVPSTGVDNSLLDISELRLCVLRKRERESEGKKKHKRG